MIEEILPALYKIEIPLPGNPLKTLNSYLIKGEERSLIIDTGMNREECLREMSSALKKLSVNLSKTDFFITHLHSDHTGLTGNLAGHGSKIYFNRLEASMVNPGTAEEHWRNLDTIYKEHGFPENELERAMKSHPGLIYGPKRYIEFTIVREDDIIRAGGYTFRCIETPGHSPGHMCLYEPDRKILICGDHILFNITPNIAFWPEMENPLAAYLSSLEKVYSLNVDLVLPGHRSHWNDHRSRIKELQEHHHARLNEVLFALEEGGKTAYQVAPCISWDIKYRSWDSFPPQQKWFAVGETIAHLKYLEAIRMIRGKKKEQTIIFSLEK